MPRLPIRTTRLILRDFSPADLAAYRELRSDPDFQRHYAPPDVSRERSAELLEEFLRWATEHPRRRFQLAIEEPRLGLLGSCGVRITEDNPTQATFGCELGREHWGRGYATEAARALIGFAFSELGVHRIQAETTSENRSALLLAKRLGMHVEVRPHGSQGSPRGRWKPVRLAILSSEWEG
jgi:RimJ/RimL family protein N-acetyltransferase